MAKNEFEIYCYKFLQLTKYYMIKTLGTFDNKLYYITRLIKLCYTIAIIIICKMYPSPLHNIILNIKPYNDRITKTKTLLILVKYFISY